MDYQIKTLDTFNVIGMQTFGNPESGCFAEIWNIVHANAEIDIPNKTNIQVWYGIETYTSEMDTLKKWFYMPCTEVSSLEQIPVQMTGKVIPANTYAVFEYHGAIGPKLGELYQRIYQQWLPTSGYELAGPYDFERYDERFQGPDNESSTLEIYVPIKGEASNNG